MNETPRTVVLLAGGRGTRMKSEMPKVLIPVCGRPMLQYAIDALRCAGVVKICVVVGYKADLVIERIGKAHDLEFAFQRAPLGTGDAVRAASDFLKRLLESVPPTCRVPIFVTAGDAPLLQSETIREMYEIWDKTQPACLIGSICVENPHGLGRILRDADGNFLAIVEEKDATPDQRAIREVNQSYYIFEARSLMSALNELRPNNAQSEYYLTDVPAILHSRGERVEVKPVLRPVEAISINTPEELKRVEETLRQLDVR
ncbi:MAG: NTP transferase domain-containing protein [Planctomycetia bacterium]|nr:NTP transferase domain-containing protein [Planctomycetia bacterium]